MEIFYKCTAHVTVVPCTFSCTPTCRSHENAVCRTFKYLKIKTKYSFWFCSTAKYILFLLKSKHYDVHRTRHLEHVKEKTTFACVRTTIFNVIYKQTNKNNLFTLNCNNKVCSAKLIEEGQDKHKKRQAVTTTSTNTYGYELIYS